MKLIYLLPKHKKLNHRHSVSQFKRNAIHYENVRAKRRRWHEVNRKKKLAKKNLNWYNEVAVKQTPIVAPRIFSLRANTLEFIDFIQLLEERYLSNKPVHINMRYIEKISIDAIGVLLSCLAKFKDKGIFFGGSYPKNKACRSKLLKSGFFDLVGSTYQNMVTNNLYRLRGNNDTIVTHGHVNVDHILTSEIILEANLHLHGEKRRNPLLQLALIELMSNTVQHATAQGQERKEWWISIEKVENKVCFSFIDFGMGIFESLNQRSLLGILKNMFKHESNAECLRDIFLKIRHETSTKELFRGNGLPSLKDALDNNCLNNLEVLTNNTYASIASDEYKELSSSFTGTFFYFELTKENHSYEYIEHDV